MGVLLLILQSLFLNAQTSNVFSFITEAQAGLSQTQRWEIDSIMSKGIFFPSYRFIDVNIASIRNQPTAQFQLSPEATPKAISVDEMEFNPNQKFFWRGKIEGKAPNEISFVGEQNHIAGFIQTGEDFYTILFRQNNFYTNLSRWQFYFYTCG